MSAKYLVIDVSSGKRGKQYPISFLDDVPEGGWSEEYKTNKIVLRHISAGEFRMGLRGERDSGRSYVANLNDAGSHHVELTNSFYMGVFPLTQVQWMRVMGNNPSSRRGDNAGTRPVECVSYEDVRGTGVGANWPRSSDVDARSFMGRLRAKTGLPYFDLPTEAQWEYACRSLGEEGPVGLLDELTLCDDRIVEGAELVAAMNRVAWYYRNADHTTHAVGEKEPNGLGLYDMQGNVFEWCLDWYGSYSFKAVNPIGETCGKGRVMRGGCWCSSAEECLSVRRHQCIPDYQKGNIGFRLCCHTDEIDPSTLQPTSSGSGVGILIKWIAILVGLGAAAKYFGIV